MYCLRLIFIKLTTDSHLLYLYDKLSEDCNISRAWRGCLFCSISSSTEAGGIFKSCFMESGGWLGATSYTEIWHERNIIRSESQMPRVWKKVNNSVWSKRQDSWNWNLYKCKETSLEAILLLSLSFIYIMMEVIQAVLIFFHYEAFGPNFPVCD